MVAATATSVVAIIPAFLVGATSVLMRGDLGFGQAGVGSSITGFFLASSAIAALAGRTVERLGPTTSLRLICIGSGSVVIAMAVLIDGIVELMVLMALAGTVNGFSQCAANLTLARRVRSRQGLMFGIKQSAVPVATLLAGASVPAVALHIGWRMTFALTGVLSWIVIFAIPGGMGAASPTSGSTRSTTANAGRRLVPLSVAAGCGTAGATAMASFLVEAATSSGMSVSAAGWLQVLGSVAGVAARLTAGRIADRGRRPALDVIAFMLGVGAAGYALLSLDEAGLTMAGTLLAYSFGWGWTGLLMYAVVGLYPDAPATATGIVVTGAAAGAALGPLIFGLAVTHATFAVAWWLCAASALVAAGLVLLSRRQLRRSAP